MFFVLAGESYFTRLWCVWELYVRFALSGDVEPKIQVAEVVGEGVAREKLSNFRLSAACCFDPNQQAHLLAAIARAPGRHAMFAAQVRGLAVSLPEAKPVEGVPLQHSRECRSRTRCQH